MSVIDLSAKRPVDVSVDGCSYEPKRSRLLDVRTATMATGDVDFDTPSGELPTSAMCSSDHESMNTRDGTSGMYVTSEHAASGILKPDSSGDTSTADDAFSFSPSPATMPNEKDSIAIQKKLVSCLRSECSTSSRPRKRVVFSQGPFPENPDGHPRHEGMVAKPSGTSQPQPTFPPEALTKANLLSMAQELGAEFERENAASITRLKRRVRLSPMLHVPRPYAWKSTAQHSPKHCSLPNQFTPETSPPGAESKTLASHKE